VHDISLFSHDPAENLRHTPRFVDASSSAYDEMSTQGSARTLVVARWKRLLVACSRAGEDRATAFLSLGSPSNQEHSSSQAPYRSHSPTIDPTSSRPARISVSKLTKTQQFFETPTVLIIAADVPSVHVLLQKPIFDGLQLWADDVSQFFERVLASPAVTQPPSRNPSLIGSRFFADTRTTGSKDSSTGTSGILQESKTPNSETVLKVVVSEGIRTPLLPIFNN